MSSTVTASTRRELASPALLWAAWIASRLIGLAIVVQGSSAHPELSYYFDAINGQDPGEYPLPLLAPLYLVSTWGAETSEAFAYGYVQLVLVLDAVIAAYLIHAHRHRTDSQVSPSARLWASGFWILFGMLAGPSLYMRLDIFPAFLVAASAAVVATNPRLASATLAIATSFKLWPGVLAAGLVGRLTDRQSWNRIGWFFGTLITVLLGVIAFRGPDRALSPLSYQTDRGLQVESVLATPFLIRGYFREDLYNVGYAASKSFEITGPGVDAALIFSAVGSIIAVLLMLMWAGYRLFVGHWTPQLFVNFSTAAVLLLLITNKVLSPQYLIWVGPLLAVTLLMRGSQETLNRDEESASAYCGFLPSQLVAVAMVMAMGLTTFVYPFAYDDIVFRLGSEWTPVATLALRNLLLILSAVGAMYVLVKEELLLHRRRSRNEEAVESQDRLSSKLGSDQPEPAEPEPSATSASEGRRLSWGVDWDIAALVAASGSAIRLLLLALMARKQEKSFGGELKSWDAEYYIKIAEGGYFNADFSFDDEIHYHTMAFFPGFPFILRTVHDVTHIPYGVAAFLINFLFLTLAAGAVMAIATRSGANRPESILCSLVVTCAPMAVVFNMPYTEAMFIALSFWAIVAMIDQKWIMAGLLVTATGFVRLTAVDLVFVCGVMVLFTAFRNWKAWASLVLSVLPISGYPIWANSHLEEKGGYFGVQAEYWSSQFDFGVATVRWILNTMLDCNNVGFFFSMMSMIAVPLLLFATWKRMPWPAWLFCATLAANVLLSDGVMHSRPRLLLPAALLLVPIVLDVFRKLGARTALFSTGVWVLFGSWFSAYMLTSFEWAI